MVDRHAGLSDGWCVEDRAPDALFQSRQIPLLGNRVRTDSQDPMRRPAFTRSVIENTYRFSGSGREDCTANHAMGAFDVGNVA